MAIDKDIIFKHRINAVVKDPPMTYRLYDDINGWHNVWFETLDDEYFKSPDGTRIKKKKKKCRCSCY